MSEAVCNGIFTYAADSWLMSRLTISTQITLIAGLLCLVMMAATTGGGAYVARDRVLASTEMRVAGLAGTMADALDRGMFERYRDVNVLANMAPLQDSWLNRPDTIRRMLGSLQASLPDYAWIGFVTPDGIVRSATGGLLEGQSVKAQPWFKGGLVTRYVGEVHDAKLLAGLLKPNASGEPLRLVDFAAPVRDEQGRIIGVLGAHLNWSWAEQITRLLGQKPLVRAGTEFWILSNRGTLLLGHEGVRPYSEDQLDAMSLRGSGAFFDEEASGDKVTGYARTRGYRDYPGLNWTVLVREPSAVAMAVARQTIVTIALIGVATAILGIAMIAVLSVKVAKPLRILTQAADRIGREEGVTMLPRVSGSQEVVKLSGALRSLLRRAGDAEQKALIAEERAQHEDERHNEDIEQLRRLADTDPLSGLLNRRAFLAAGEAAAQAFRQTARSYAVMVIDMDHFKIVNDTYGHAVGDEVIRHVAGILGGCMRAVDRVARFGGEEFVVLLGESGAEGACQLAQRIRQEIQERYVSRDGQAIRITVSIGVTVALATDRDIEDVIARADHGLYQAKAAGRDRVVFERASGSFEEARAA